MANQNLSRSTLSSRRLVIVTGLSGAGKSTALKALEDCGFHSVDNLPLDVIEMVTPALLMEGNVAIGVDSRTQGFDAALLRKSVEHLKSTTNIIAEILFLDAADSILVQRYSETRRIHPLSKDRPIEDGISMERSLLDPVRKYASSTIDTTTMSTTDTRLLVKDRMGSEEAKLVLTLMSFGYSKGIPRGADLVFDVRFLRNPHYETALKPLTGQTAAVQSYVADDPAYEPFVTKVVDLLSFLMPKYKAEGKSYLTIAFGCTGGKHRSVMMVEKFSGLLDEDGLELHCWHRDMPKD
ncbi:RNase adapter RapZ [Temperatibacter marinus]|uniref:RNase adapter RapZ n=1 Tax=Temperatibacter marinus TaxID=1456591 RepID=A0AA52EJG7_9PROT|nr:RNase adapter RapZ [Temperatibacter marinus]WND03925.1 RNase adapter RapZ [Temperatibacter marinus]